MNSTNQEEIIPQCPFLSASALDLWTSMVLKAIPSYSIGQRNSQELALLSRSIFERGVQNLAYKDNGWCGSGRHPGQRPQPTGESIIDTAFNLGYYPDTQTAGSREFHAGIIRQLAEAVLSRLHASELRYLAASIALNVTELAS